MARFTRVFGIPELRVRFVRSLRFRLLLSYVLFFTLLLVGIGLLFRGLLKSQLLSEVQTTLVEQWDEARGYFDIENEEPVWSKVQEDALVVSELQQIYLIADGSGNYLGYNEDTLDAINFDAAEIQRIVSESQPQAPTVRMDKNKESYLVKAGRVSEVDKNDHKRWYFLAIGRPLRSTQNTVDNFTRTYFFSLLGLIPMSSIFGWVVAGRALRPLNSVAQAAQDITGSNLSLQIPLRGAGDELDHLIDSFNRMTARLGQSFEQIRRFSTDVSHELRTPLTAIRGQLEVALFTAETPDQYRDAMVNALEDVEQLSSIVRALLLLSQAESGQLVLQKVPLDAGEAVLDFVDQFQIPAQEKSIRLTAIAVPGSIIPADRTQFERLLSNLLSNAIKYTPNGGSVSVRVGPSDSPAFVSLEVQDTGVGIPAENLPHIFDRFYRVRSPQTNPTYGLGLGLSFVSWIVEAHGGRIDVASTVGEGTRFRILLPRNVETPHPNPAETAAAPLH
ncbi:MAG TPA: ATP-binding protein [Bryobacteraceae bacterium]|jgi:heavy metal sensor kinase